jgi:hypothetical protein
VTAATFVVVIVVVVLFAVLLLSKLIREGDAGGVTRCEPNAR